MSGATCSQEDDEGVLLDGELVRQLATQKLEKHAAKVKEEGAAWVDIRPQWTTRIAPAYGRVRTALRAADRGGAGAARCAECTPHGDRAQIEAAQEGDDERYDELSEQIEARGARSTQSMRHGASSIPRSRRVPAPWSRSGMTARCHIERGLAQAGGCEALRAGRESARPSDPQEPRQHSAALVRRLTAHRTLALQAVLTAAARRCAGGAHASAGAQDLFALRLHEG